MTARHSACNRTFPLLLLSLLLSFTALDSAGAAQNRQWTEEQAQDFAARLESYRLRLALTPAQEQEFRKIMEINREERRQLLEKHGFSGSARPDLSFRDKISLGKEMKKLREKGDNRASTVLTPEQMKEYGKIRDEAREEFRQKMKNK